VSFGSFSNNANCSAGVLAAIVSLKLLQYFRVSSFEPMSASIADALSFIVGFDEQSFAFSHGPVSHRPEQGATPVDIKLNHQQLCVLTHAF
jgi:hypothetical protein